MERPDGEMILGSCETLGLRVEKHYSARDRNHSRPPCREPRPRSFRHGRMVIARAGLPPSFTGIGEQLQRVELRPEVAEFRNGLSMERTAVQPLLERRLVLGRDLACIETCHPCRGLGFNGCRVGKRQDSALVGHYAFTPS